MAIVPERRLRVIVPTAPKSRVTQSFVPSGRFTLLTETVRVLKPPQPLNFVMSAVADPLGVRVLEVGPLRASFFTPPGSAAAGDRGGRVGVGGGGRATVSENVPVAVEPSASVTVTLKVDVPSVVGDPKTSPEGLSARPAGTAPDHVYGEWPPLARKLVEKKLLTNTLLPAPMSHTPLAHVMNCVLMASGGAVPAPEPVSGTLLATLLWVKT